MKLVVGLGNPGADYAGTRHNAGFLVLDRLVSRLGETWRRKFKGRVSLGRIGTQDVVFLKPWTYMNLSGESVAPCAQFYDIAPEDTLVVHDELDLPHGELRIKSGGGHGGHNGLKSLFKLFAPGSFTRLRFGIGRPEYGDITSWVLGEFSQDERIALDELTTTAARICEDVVQLGANAAMNIWHGKTNA